MRAIDGDKIVKILNECIDKILAIQNLDITYNPKLSAELQVYKDMLEDINEMPTIDPEPHWIPCSERLPEEREWIGTKKFGTTISDEVYVTIEVSSGKRITKHMCFENGSIPAFEQRSIDVFYKGGKVVAWMPLPEPYAERRTDEHID